MRRPLLPDNLEKNLISILLAALIPVMLAAALCRHLWPEMHAPVLKFAAGCLAWLSSCGMARAAALGLHVRVSLLDGGSEKRRLRLENCADIAFLLFSLFSLAVGAVALAGSLLRDMPSHPLIYAAIPAGSALTVHRLAQRLRARKREGAA